MTQKLRKLLTKKRHSYCKRVYRILSSGSVLGILKKTESSAEMPCVKKQLRIDFFTHKSVKNNGIEPQIFCLRGIHNPSHHRENGLAVGIEDPQRTTVSETGAVPPKATHRGPREIPSGLFTIVDSSWDEEKHAETSAHPRNQKIRTHLDRCRGGRKTLYVIEKE